MGDFGVFLLFGLAALAAFGIGAWFKAKRRKELSAWATLHGLYFNPSRLHALDHQYGQFSCLREGSRRYAFNQMTGQWKAHDFLGFDYHYETYSHSRKGGRRTNHHYFSAVIMTFPYRLTPLFIRPENFFDKFTEFVGFDDIDFESSEFSKKFYVKSPDKKWAFDVLHQRTMQFMLESPMFTIQIDGCHAIVWRKSRFKPHEFGEAADLMAGIIERFPDYLVKQLTEPHGMV